MLQDRYAGRFQIGVGTDHPPVEGIYAVREKRLNPTYGSPGAYGSDSSDRRVDGLSRRSE